MRYRKKKIRNQIRGTGQAKRRGREELEGRVEGKEARTNRASDLRRECLRTYPACINKEAAERTEFELKQREQLTEKASWRTMSNMCVGVSRLCPAATL